VPEENLELVRRTVEAFNARDVEALPPLYQEDFVFRLIGGFADLMGQEFVGHDAAIGWMMEMIDMIGGRIEMEALHAVDGRALAIYRFEATGAASGAETTLRTAFLYSFRDGRIAAVDGYYDVEEARRAAGL
jgi:ketosteroid isomerase-like protein